MEDFNGEISREDLIPTEEAVKITQWMAKVHDEIVQQWVDEIDGEDDFVKYLDSQTGLMFMSVMLLTGVFKDLKRMFMADVPPNQAAEVLREKLNHHD